MAAPRSFEPLCRWIVTVVVATVGATALAGCAGVRRSVRASASPARPPARVSDPREGRDPAGAPWGDSTP
jgi:hypothetical protein